MTPTERPLHLVGSVPLSDADAVFRAAGAMFGPKLKRVPDGETGDRKGWIGWQRQQFADQPVLEQAAAKEREYQFRPPFRVRAGHDPAQIRFGDLCYARIAIESYAKFLAARKAGSVTDQCRFLVALPTPWAPVYSSIAYESQQSVFPRYEAALLVELDRIVSSIPKRDLAVQWDVATELSWLEGVYPSPFADTWSGVVAALARLGTRVPGEVELGYHLCYGSAGNKHWKEPESSALMVRLCNALAAAVPRRIDWWHIPVPRERFDDAYFAPLRELRIAPESEFYLGLVHLDGLAENRRRMATAMKFLPRFGVAAECGLGRYEAAEVPGLFDMLRQSAAP